MCSIYNRRASANVYYRLKNYNTTFAYIYITVVPINVSKHPVTDSPINGQGTPYESSSRRAVISRLRYFRNRPRSTKTTLRNDFIIDKNNLKRVSTVTPRRQHRDGRSSGRHKQDMIAGRLR